MISLAALHPLFVHFPIALFFASFLLHLLHMIRETWVMRSVPLIVFGLALASGFVSLFSGQEATVKVSQKISVPSEPYNAIQIHDQLATYSFWVSIAFFIGWAWVSLKYPEQKKINQVILAFLLFFAISILITSYLGTQLVTKYGIRVDS